MNRTLPLFDADPVRIPAGDTAGDAASEPAGGHAASAGSLASRAPRVDADPGRERHLRAAWRLSRSMWRFPDHSPQQTRAGLAICRHLQALLAESQERPPR